MRSRPRANPSDYGLTVTLNKGDITLGMLPVGIAVEVSAAGEAGAFAELDAKGVMGDGLTAHHMPQAAMGFTTREAGGALILPDAEHALTRTYFQSGAKTLRLEQGMQFRSVLARDLRDIRQLFGSKYDPGLRDLMKYYRLNFPQLLAR